MARPPDCPKCTKEGAEQDDKKTKKKCQGPTSISRRASCSDVANSNKILEIKHVLKSRPMNLNVLALPSKKLALSNWKMYFGHLPPDMLEQLKGIVQGVYKGVCVDKCIKAIGVIRKRRDAAKATADDDKIVCCCKKSCTFISTLLKKLKNVKTTDERRSLTCVIFDDLCKLSGINPDNQADDTRNAAFVLAQKFGAWIDHMLEKKDLTTCASELVLQTQHVLSKIYECACFTDKKLAAQCNPPKPPEGKAASAKQGKGGKGGKKK